MAGGPPITKLSKGQAPPGKQYEAKLTIYVVLCCITAAGAGVRAVIVCVKRHACTAVMSASNLQLV